MPDFTDTLRPSEPSGPSLIANERSQSSIAVNALSQHLLSHDGFLERQSKILPIVSKHPLLQKAQQANLSRPQRFKLALARAKLLRRLADEHAWSQEEHDMAEYLVDDVSPYMLHMGMFITTIREQASDEQRKEWLPRIEKWKIIGAYAQTELGHGSNVRGLELEARYDPEGREFVLHSPTLTASKWWNGTLGRTANHAVVVAQLLLPDDKGEKGGDGELKYVSHGPHPFIVQVRDMKSHQPLDGIVIGDIGPKYGYATMDNAYMLFNHFRIPHSALLSRYSSVDPLTGTYEKPAKSAVVYGTLTYMRSKIIQHARLVLARAVTVAVRYTTIRRQFPDRDSSPNSQVPSPELPVLDYPTVQIRILPLLATTFALHYTGLAMQRIYANTRKQIESGDFGSLAYIHSMSSGLKSLCTTLAADGVETCRRALGGHGYGGGSGLVQLNNDYLSKPTVEGDNWMITQQTAAYLVKKIGAAIERQGGAVGDEVDVQFGMYLPAVRDAGMGCEYDILGSDGDLVRSFQHRATALAYEVYQDRVIQKKSWTSLMIQFHKLSKAQSQSILVTQFHEALGGAKDLPSDTLSVLWDLYRLFAMFTLLQDRYEFFTHNAASREQLDLVPERINQLMSRIRPHAVQLVDSWKIPDYLLDSALGRYDGRVYEDLFHRAHRLNPLNKITFNPNYWEDEIAKGGDDLKAVLSKI
ncbi:hypothetical protein BDW69DRAFT_201250 [Aspergillus filifer]